jgi:hypothetical protein
MGCRLLSRALFLIALAAMTYAKNMKYYLFHPICREQLLGYTFPENVYNEDLCLKNSFFAF